MINEILTNSTWLEPQIDFLLMLQNFRELTGGVLDNFFFSLTVLGQFLIPTLIMCLIYWCIDTTAGLYLFLVNSFSLLAVQIMKNAACVYRPWILTDRLSPSEAAIKTAGGYSFPSGHSIMASSMWGGLAYLTRKKKFVCSFFIFLILLIGFSRCYLSVHTPQDVVIGILAGVLFVFLTNKFIKFCEKDKNRYLYSLGIINIIAIAVLYWTVTKDYPLDYVNGKLLVDPQKAIYVSVVYIAWVSGLINGVLLCKRFVNFDAKKGSTKAKVVRGIVGALTFCGLFYVIENYFLHNIQPYKTTCHFMFFTGIYITLIYPLIVSKLQKYFDI